MKGDKVIESVKKSSDFPLLIHWWHRNFNFNNSNDIEHIENYLNKISLTIDRKNSIENQNSILPVTSTSNNIDNNYKKIIIANDRRIDNYAILEQQQRRLESEERFLYQNNINRKVNCETANLNKIVNSSVKQINDIKCINIKKM